MNTERTRVALVEDHRLLAEALNFSLSRMSFDVVAVPCAPGKPGSTLLVQPILAQRPDVVVLHLVPSAAEHGSELVRPLARSGTPVMVLTDCEDRSCWGRWLAAGAETVMATSARLDEIVTTIRSLRLGRPAMPAARKRDLIEEWRRQDSVERAIATSLDRLSRREREVLASLASGRQVREIARESFVSEATVRTQVKSILFKLGVSSQIAAAAVARQAGLTAEPARPQPPRGTPRQSQSA
ncbi:MAG TPA: response regulator transcription factor [Nocardioidaceae bacterium]|nr:response regulator transcription factor [Nocardioidaceae bacterium]